MFCSKCKELDSSRFHLGSDQVVWPHCRLAETEQGTRVVIAMQVEGKKQGNVVSLTHQVSASCLMHFWLPQILLQTLVQSTGRHKHRELILVPSMLIPQLLSLPFRYVDLETDRGRQEGRLRSDKTGSLDSMDSMDLDCAVYSVVPGVPLPSLTSSGSSSESDDWDSNVWVNSDSDGGSSGGGGFHNSRSSSSGSDGNGSSNGSSSRGNGSTPTGATVHQGEVIAIHTRTNHVSMFDHDNSNSLKTIHTTSFTNTSSSGSQSNGSQSNGSQSNGSSNEHSQARRERSEPQNGSSSSSADRSEIGAIFVESHGVDIPVGGHPPLSPPMTEGGGGDTSRPEELHPGTGRNGSPHPAASAASPPSLQESSDRHDRRSNWDDNRSQIGLLGSRDIS